MIWSIMPSSYRTVLCHALFLGTISMAGCGGAESGMQSGADNEEAIANQSGVRSWSGWRRTPAQLSSSTAGATENGIGSGETQSTGTNTAPAGSDTILFNGGPCTNHAPVSGPCASYGDQCFYADAKGAHFCTCLVSAPSTPGIQGWSCI